MSRIHEVKGLFPISVCIVKRDLELSIEEKNEIEKIIEEGVISNIGNSLSINRYIFDTGKLKKIKQFCEEYINAYVETVINPKEEIDFYITQSWLNITKPGEYHHDHYHSNSIISGIFYIQTVEDDKITFSDPNIKVREIQKFEPKEYTVLNSSTWFFPVNNNELVLFPSWLNHKVEVNEKATTNRISLSFNTFARGVWGKKNHATELILW